MRTHCFADKKEGFERLTQTKNDLRHFCLRNRVRNFHSHLNRVRLNMCFSITRSRLGWFYLPSLTASLLNVDCCISLTAAIPHLNVKWRRWGRISWVYTQPSPQHHSACLPFRCLAGGALLLELFLRQSAQASVCTKNRLLWYVRIDYYSILE